MFIEVKIYNLSRLKGNFRKKSRMKAGLRMVRDKKYIGIMGLALVAAIVIIGYTKKDEYIVEADKEDVYVEDEYEKFLQEKVLPNMIMNNEIQGCELGKQDNQELVHEEIDLGQGIIELGDDEGFIENLDELHINLNKYAGREISFEGVIYKIEEAENPIYVIGRYFEEAHEEHSHENFFGLQGVYEGQWPAVDTWVKVEGMIGKAEFNGQELPAVIIENLTIMDTEGQRRVYN